MSLKDRLNLNSPDSKKSLINELKKEPTIMDKIFASLVNEKINMLVFCPIDIQTYNAVNFICGKISNDKRLVGIGSNLLLNPSELIKFEPDRNNQSKELIKTVLSLNPDKIILQDFDGVEAVDIFKLINSGIKNIITAVNSNCPENALRQMKLNLYLNGVNLPQNLMEEMICEFLDKIIFVNKKGEELFIENIYEVDSGYKIKEIIKENKNNNNNKTKSDKKTVDIVVPDIKNQKKSVFLSKIKKNKLNKETL